jgi:arabinan endo-1,5-alpha-L-arabinosidase
MVIAFPMRFSPSIRPLILALALAPGLAPAAAQTPHAFKAEGDIVGAHDPSMIRQGDTYYVFTTGRAPAGGQLGIRCSPNLTHWHACGQVFDIIPQWIKDHSPGTRDLWAPDISFEHGQYRLYYAYSLFGKNTSGIALATNRTLDPASPNYKWNDEGLVLESRATDDFNAIDPNYIEDAPRHAAWLAFGSFWSGIYLVAIDPATGKVLASEPPPPFTRIAARKRPEQTEPDPPNLPGNWQAIEAPFLIYHSGYYYLFVSFDLCCRGVKSTYRTMVGRAKKITGPYADRDGIPMLQGGATPLLSANAQWLGPGGESIARGDRGEDLIVFHAYDHITGKSALQISPIAWKDGWPVAALPEP